MKGKRMPVCTFFGHHDCPETIKVHLEQAIIHLIEEQAMDLFYVGNQGSFDRMARELLKELCATYPHIRYSVALAYMPGKRNPYEDHSDTILPEGIEGVPRRFAISWRNTWMLRQADYVIACVAHSWGGAAKFVEMAERQGKHVVNLADR